jgi:hypothetical protein
MIGGTSISIAQCWNLLTTLRPEVVTHVSGLDLDLNALGSPEKRGLNFALYPQR